MRFSINEGMARMRLQIGKASGVTLLAASLGVVSWGTVRAPAPRTGRSGRASTKSGFDAKVAAPG